MKTTQADDTPIGFSDVRSIVVDPPAQSRTNSPETEVRELAYRIYVQHGRVDGYDVADWLEAEKVVRLLSKLAA